MSYIAPAFSKETHNRESAALSLLSDGRADGREGRDVAGERRSCEGERWSAIVNLGLESRGEEDVRGAQFKSATPRALTAQH